MTATAVSNPFQRRAMDIEDYIDIARRHVSAILGLLYAGIVCGTVVAFLLPNVYVSRAMVRVTPSGVSDKLVPVIFSQQASDRINQLWQEITTRTSLSTLIQQPDIDLYKPERGRKPLEDIIEQMKTQDLHIEFVGAQSTAKADPTFVITFQYPDRQKAQRLVSALITQIFDANRRYGQNKDDGVTALLLDEVNQAKSELDARDRDLTAFKSGHAGQLPQELQFNANAMLSLQARLASIDDAINRDTQERLLRETTLNQAHGEVEQLQASANQVPAAPHPEKSPELVKLEDELRQKEEHLAGLRHIVTERHPDLLDAIADLETVRQRVERMRRQESSRPSNLAAVTPLASDSRQPRLQQARASLETAATQIRILDLDLAAKRAEVDSIHHDLEQYQTKIGAGSLSEQQYLELTQERAAAVQHYTDLEHRLQLARQGREASKNGVGERLELLDPASLPETPTSPNRWAIVAFGAMGGLLAGLSLAGVQEMKDGSLKNLKDVRVYTNMPVLSSIPLLENSGLTQRKRRLAYLAWAGAIVLGLLAAGSALFWSYAQK